jgi:hypothetical protein
MEGEAVSRNMSTHTRTRWARPALGVTLAAAVLAGCGSGASPSSPPNHDSSTASQPTATTAGSTTPPTAGPPSGVPPVPDGVYRSDVTEAVLTKHGPRNPEEAGVWTLTIKHDQYTWQCSWNDKTGRNCGEDGTSEPNATVEHGTLRGDNHWIWFVTVPDAEQNGPTSPYAVRWQLTGNKLALSDFYGTGDYAGLLPPVNSLNAQPYTKIG